VWHLVAGLEAAQYAEGMRRRVAATAGLTFPNKWGLPERSLEDHHLFDIKTFDF